MKLAKLIGFAIIERIVGFVSLSYFFAGEIIVTLPVTSPSA